jgi:hypothetical protein
MVKIGRGFNHPPFRYFGIYQVNNPIPVHTGSGYSNPKITIELDPLLRLPSTSNVIYIYRE